MSTLDKYVEELKNQGEGGLNKKKEALKETAESDKKTINAYADDSLQSIRDGYNADVADAHESYEDAFRKNEVQVKLNERYLERKAAEMGLTDSGLNRTQMTANQLSYANQKGELTAQKQKKIDTLAAAMRAKITEVNTKRNDALAAVDSTLKKDIAQADMDFDKSIRETAAEMVKADKEAETEAQKLLLQNQSDNSTAKENLIKNLKLDDASENEKLVYINDYVSRYGITSDIAKVANDNGFLVTGSGKIYNKADFNLGEDAKTGKGALGQIFYSNKYSDDYKYAAYVLYTDLYGLPDEKLTNALLDVSNLSMKGLKRELYGN